MTKVSEPHIDNFMCFIFMAYYFDVYETSMISACMKVLFINMWTHSLCI